MDTEPGEKELVRTAFLDFPLYNSSRWIQNLVGRNWWRTAFLDFPLCNYFYVDTEPGGKELVAHCVPGFSSI